MSRERRNVSALWNFFTKVGELEAMRAKCNLCSGVLSYKSSTGNLNSHLKRQHGASFSKLSNIIKKRTEDKNDADEDSNSSIKFSSEIWSHFETEGEGAHCTVCQQDVTNTVEEMRSHLEDEHPGLMITILNKKDNSQKDDNEASDDERAVNPMEEEIFTEVLYLDDEKPKPAKRSRPSRTVDRRSSRTSELRTEPQKVEYTVIEKLSESRPEVEAFLTYIRVLLQNVPKETMPKLQLDIISSILNAQMANNKPAVSVANVIPVSNTLRIPVTSENLINNGGILHTETAKYHITIDNGLVQKSP